MEWSVAVLLGYFAFQQAIVQKLFQRGQKVVGVWYIIASSKTVLRLSLRGVFLAFEHLYRIILSPL